MKDLITKTTEELVLLIKEDKKKVHAMVSAFAGMKSKLLKEGRQAKKRIAHIHTILNSREK